MKNILIAIVIVMGILASCSKKDTTEKEKTIEISMGAHQYMDVYYSFLAGEVSSADRSDWDLAFSVPLQTAAIRINEGAGVQLYSVGDTTVWESIDTTGILAWESLYNDKSDWMRGAFNLDADGIFDFGWAIYDHGNTYDVIGLHMYVIKLSDGSYKKLFIRKKIGSTNTYVLQWANIDGSNQVDATFSPAAYSVTKDFIHYSLVNKQIMEVEPDIGSWDLLFTRYMEKIPTGPGSEMDYPVMGVLLNKNIEGVIVTGIPPAEAHYSNAEDGFSYQADIIGWEWKIQDMATHTISITENTSYFVKLADGGIYKIYFTDYAGEAEGSLSMQQFKVE